MKYFLKKKIDCYIIVQGDSAGYVFERIVKMNPETDAEYEKRAIKKFDEFVEENKRFSKGETIKEVDL